MHMSGLVKRKSARVFGIRDLRYLKAGIRDFTAKWGRDSGLKVYARDAGCCK